MGVLGIIPAAGMGSRWGGFYKELLPTEKGEWLIDRTISNMVVEGKANKVCVVTNLLKASTHMTHLNNKFNNLFYILQRGKNDIYSAIESSFPFAEDLNYFAMPDTYMNRNIFNNNFYLDFHLGVFRTKMPERFGVLEGDRVYNKQIPYEEGKEFLAWGALVWTSNVVEFWQAVQPTDYTDAINKAMEVFEWDTFPIDFYYDFASWEDYWKFLNE